MNHDDELSELLHHWARRGSSVPVLETIVAVRALGEQPAPAPSAELRLFLEDRSAAGSAMGTGALTAGSVPELDDAAAMAPLTRRHGRKRLSRAAARFAGLSLAAKVALGSGVAFASVTGAGAAGVLPAPLQDAVADVVSAVTPFELSRGSQQPVPGVDIADLPAGQPTEERENTAVESPVGVPTGDENPTDSGSPSLPAPVQQPVPQESAGPGPAPDESVAQPPQPATTQEQPRDPASSQEEPPARKDPSPASSSPSPGGADGAPAGTQTAW